MDLFTSLARRERLPEAAPSATASVSSVSLYLRHPGVFLATGAIFIPIGIASAFLNDRLELDYDDVVLSLSLVGGLPLIAAFVVVSSTVDAILREIDAGRRPGVLDGYRIAWTHIRALSWARVRALAIVSLLALVIVGLPFAFQRLVRWLFVEQAIILDGTDSRTALAVSARAVRGRWWRTAALVVVLAIVGGRLGPVVAIALLMLLHLPTEVANLVSSAVYAFALPLVFIAATQFYRVLKGAG